MGTTWPSTSRTTRPATRSCPASHEGGRRRSGDDGTPPVLAGRTTRNTQCPRRQPRMTTPSPSIMQRFAPKAEPILAVAADVAPAQPGRVRLGTVAHDGVIKAKHAESGQVVRAWLTIRGVPQPCGGERVIEMVSR